MDDETWNEVLASMAGEVPAEAAMEAAPDAATPADGTPPIAADAVVDPLPADPTPSTSESPLPITDTAAAEPEPVAPVAPNWDSPDNPHFQDAQALRQLREMAAEAKANQARETMAKNLSELSDGDNERLGQLHGVIRTAVAPIAQQAQAFEQRATTSEKVASAMWIAMQAHLPEADQKAVMEQINALMAVDGVETMQQVAFGKRDSERLIQAAVAEKDRYIAELESRLGAKGELADRRANGVDLVDGGTGSAPDVADIQTRLRDAPDMDSYWSILTGRATQAA